MRTEPPFQALIFDAGGVFVPHDNAALFQRLAGRCTAEDALARIRAHSAERGLSTGRTPVAALHHKLTRELGYTGDWPTFLDDWSSHLGVDHEMLGLMRVLSQRHRVAIFSNTNHEHWTHVTALAAGGLDGFEIHLSHEIGAMKPDAEAFGLVARRAGVDPARCLFIDDVLENVEGARRAGFQAEQFTGQGALEALLEHRGVRWTRHKQEAYP